MPKRDILFYGIEELELGVRSYNFCKRNGVHTVGDLMALSVETVNTWQANSGSTLGLRAFKELAEAQEYAYYCYCTS